MRLLKHDRKPGRWKKVAQPSPVSPNMSKHYFSKLLSNIDN